MTDTDPSALKLAIDQLKGHSLSARIRPLLPDLDRKIRDGVRHEDILAILRAAGIDISLEAFRKCLYRYRAKLRDPVPAEASATEITKTSPIKSTPIPVSKMTSQERLDELFDPKCQEEYANQFMNRRPNIFAKKGAKS